MIKTLSVVNYLGEQLDLPLASSHEKEGIYIKSITGIGPGKASINTVSLASDDGGIFNSARLDIRNIVITVGFYESVSLHNSIEEARLKTYKYFPNKKPLTLIIETDIRSLYIDGYVESNEPDIFQKEETAQISIICPDPKFYNADGDSFIHFGGIDNLFEFPYSNESLTENLTEMGSISIGEVKFINYDGDEETGVTIDIHPLAKLENLEIINLSKQEMITIDDSVIGKITESDGILPYDEIEICTVKGKKSATLLRNGVTYNIINALGRDPAWFQLFKGQNAFFFTASSGGSDLEMEIFYSIAYAGV